MNNKWKYENETTLNDNSSPKPEFDRCASHTTTVLLNYLIIWKSAAAY